MSIKLKIGDKVKIPKTKSTGVPLGHSNMVAAAKSMGQDFLYIKRKDDIYSLGVSMDGIAGDHFTIDDIELYDEQPKENQKLIGYKIKSEYLHSKKSILESIDCVDASDLGGGAIFQKGSILYDNACKLSVIDLWFEKVYKEREQTITLSNGQQVLLKMNTDYFVVEGIKVLVNDIKELIKPRFALGNRLNTWAITLVDFKINIGCWNDITYADLKLIIDTHSELNEK